MARKTNADVIILCKACGSRLLGSHQEEHRRQTCSARPLRSPDTPPAAEAHAGGPTLRRASRNHLRRKNNAAEVAGDGIHHAVQPVNTALESTPSCRKSVGKTGKKKTGARKTSAPNSKRKPNNAKGGKKKRRGRNSSLLAEPRPRSAPLTPEQAATRQRIQGRGFHEGAAVPGSHMRRISK